jgi:hypothetical protein
VLAYIGGAFCTAAIGYISSCRISAGQTHRLTAQL